MGEQASKIGRKLEGYGECLFPIKLFSSMCDRHSAWQVWSDFVEVSAIAISNTVSPAGKKKDEREKHYLEIMKRYSQQERLIFPKLLAITTNALEINPDQDFLGELFMALELGSHWKGQFFTPYSVCRMMSAVSDQDLKDKVEKEGWISVNDCACGAGATLIGMRNQLARNHMDWSTQAFFVAQDIDRNAGMMCYIQLSLLGCAGYVVIADSLRHPIVGKGVLHPQFTPEQDAWILPTTMFSPVWVLRTLKSREESKETPVEEQEAIQLSMF